MMGVRSGGVCVLVVVSLNIAQWPRLCPRLQVGEHGVRNEQHASASVSQKRGSDGEDRDHWGGRLRLSVAAHR
jgi:hypothetical protein